MLVSMLTIKTENCSLKVQYLTQDINNQSKKKQHIGLIYIKLVQYKVAFNMIGLCGNMKGGSSEDIVKLSFTKKTKKNSANIIIYKQHKYGCINMKRDTSTQNTLERVCWKRRLGPRLH